MKLKAKLGLGTALSAVLTSFFGAAFINNVAVVMKWYRAFRESGGDSTKIPVEIHGIISWLDWSAVDYSCVSTLVPFLGFALLLRGFIRLLVGNRKIDSEFFPFFRSYDQLNVAFGLIGTLWGIILIGYYDMDTVTMANLMTCIHTALFSTLIAVVWVYVVDHPFLRPMMRSFLAESVPDNGEDDDVDDILFRLREGALGISEVWEKERANLSELADSISFARGTMDGFTSDVGKLASDIKALADGLAVEQKRALDSVSALIERFCAAEADRETKLKASVEEHLDAITSAFAKHEAAFATAIAKQLDEIAKAQIARDGRLADSVGMRLEEMSLAQHARDKDFSAAADKRLEEIATALHARLDALSKAQIDREAKFDDMLEARVRKLCDESAANAVRADKAEAMIERVKSVFGQNA